MDPYIHAFNVAVDTERAAWEKVRSRRSGPGSFDQAMWQEWIDAVRRTNAAQRAVRLAFSEQTALPDPDR